MTGQTAQAAHAEGATGTARYLVVGNPIAHSRSPQIHAEFARETGHAILYERQLVALEPADAFERAVAAFAAAGGSGLNVTLPFKERAFILAARHHFGVSAAQLSPAQAARLAAMLPRPRYYDRHRDSVPLARRAAIVQRRMPAVDVP